MTKYIPTVEAVCCRSWPVDPTTRIGRCGLCGERPVITPGQVPS